MSTFHKWRRNDKTVPTSAESRELKKKETNTLKNLINSLNQSYNTCSLVQSGKYLVSYSFNTSNVSQSNSWTVDSGATDHMTHSSTKLESYNPCPVNKKITVVDGSPITIAGQGTVNWTPTLPSLLQVKELCLSLMIAVE